MTLAQRALASARLLSGAYVAARWLRERVRDVDPMYSFAGFAVLGEIVGARVFYLCERDPGALLVPGRLLKPRLTVDGAAAWSCSWRDRRPDRHRPPQRSRRNR